MSAGERTYPLFARSAHVTHNLGELLTAASLLHRSRLPWLSHMGSISGHPTLVSMSVPCRNMMFDAVDALTAALQVITKLLYLLSQGETFSKVRAGLLY